MAESVENDKSGRRGRPRKNDDELSIRSQRRRMFEELSSFRVPSSPPLTGVLPVGEISASRSPVGGSNDPANEILCGVDINNDSFCSTVSNHETVSDTSESTSFEDELAQEGYLESGSNETSDFSVLADNSCSLRRENLEHEHLQENESNIQGVLHFDCDTCLYCRCMNWDICLHSDFGDCTHCENCLFECNSEDSGDDNFNEDFGGLEKSESLDNEVVLPSEDANNLIMRKDLTEIFLRRQASHALINDILGFLNKHNLGKFPKSAKTLLHTPSTVVRFKEVPPGQYWHCGITEHILKFASESGVGIVDVTISVDGVPLFNSTAKSFWPLTCSLNGSPDVLIVGVYLGNEKPKNANDYLKYFVDEITPLCKDGVTVNGKLVKVNVVCVICDAPAKSFLLSTKSFNAYCGCSKCTTEGDMIGRRICYPQLDAPLRTDESFVNQAQEEYHKDRSILETIPRFGCVTGVPLDYMHLLLLLGIMRKLMYMWLEGPLTVRLPSVKAKAISNLLISLVGWVPCDFARKPRPLQYIKRFNATEFRLILLYLGVVVFRKILPKAIYEHFLVFHVVTTIYVDPTFCIQHLDLAKELAKYFVGTFIHLNGQQYVSHNIHSFIHLGDDVEKFGPLDNFSAFKFENFYQFLIKLMRKGEKPLEQLVNRYSETKACGFFPDKVAKSYGQCSGHSKSIHPCGCWRLIFME